MVLYITHQKWVLLLLLILCNSDQLVRNNITKVCTVETSIQTWSLQYKPFEMALGTHRLSQRHSGGKKPPPLLTTCDMCCCRG